VVVCGGYGGYFESLYIYVNYFFISHYFFLLCRQLKKSTISTTPYFSSTYKAKKA
jgi:hypothetical protein